MKRSNHGNVLRDAKYGGMELSETQRLKQLEDENRRLDTSSPNGPWTFRR
jgi:hypothetical protein